MRLLFLFFILVNGDSFEEEEYGVKYADRCELCKIVTNELEASLATSSKSHDVIETGYSVEKAKKKTKYAVSELRLVEAVEGLCEKLLEYSVHKERKDWTRFSRGTSETFKALEGLVDKGVKVDIGIPHELWHKPSAEITHLKTQCEALMEEHEEDVEDWYFKRQKEETLETFLCRNRYLKGHDKSCLEVKGEKTEL